MPKRRRADLQQSSTRGEAVGSASGEAECRPDSSAVKKKNYRWKRTRASHRSRQDPVAKALAQAQLIQLEALAATGQIALKYLDETGCVSGRLKVIATAQWVNKSGLNKPHVAAKE